MTHTAVASYPGSFPLSNIDGRSGLTGPAMPPRKPKRRSEQADPANLVPSQYEEPVEDVTPGPDEAESDEPEFNEPSESSDVDEFPDPTP